MFLARGHEGYQDFPHVSSIAWQVVVRLNRFLPAGGIRP
jgi:hypothetical protein